MWYYIFIYKYLSGEIKCNLRLKSVELAVMRNFQMKVIQTNDTQNSKFLREIAHCI